MSLDSKPITVNFDELYKHCQVLCYAYTTATENATDQIEKKFYQGHLRGIQQVMEAMLHHKTIEHDNIMKDMFEITDMIKLGRSLYNS